MNVFIASVLERETIREFWHQFGAKRATYVEFFSMRQLEVLR